MARIIESCKYCGLPAIERSRKPFGKEEDNNFLLQLQCGHAMVTKIKRSKYDDLMSASGKKPFPFQIGGIEFIEDTDFRCLIGDEMGLGKTIQYLLALLMHEEKLPVLLTCKAGLKRQLELEVYDWTGHLPQTIESSTQKVFPFPVTIVAYDTLARMKAPYEKFHFIKTIVLDECQYIKNEDAKRTNAVRLLVSKVGIKNVIGVSGTPIKNKADEFFPILNLISPTKFPTKHFMMNRYFDFWTDAQGNYHIVKPYQSFFEALDGIMIRRTREEVAPELPNVRRMFFNSEMENKDLRKSYAEVQKEFERFMMDQETNPTAGFSTSLLGFFARMRRITGFSKIQPVTEFVTDFLISCDRKIVIFGHHKETLEALKEVLDTWCISGGWADCAQLKSSMDADERQRQVTRFKEDAGCRILIASTLASGEGLNLQFCSDAIMMERQWNPANEEQAETRFTRFGSKAEHVNITYMISAGTIDEWLTELVEKKRALFDKIINRNEDASWDESSLMKELADIIFAKGGKRWTY